jgi:phosphatidate cytidylyltransferase
LTGCIVGLRLEGPAGRGLVLFLLAVIFLGDTGAYYVGRAFGRRPLAPRISPKKTVAGLVGGLAASVAGALVFGLLMGPGFSMVESAALGLALSLLGVSGDLFESFLKRSAGVKDAGGLVPGHGGVLDRVDGLLFGAPALFLYVRSFPPG